MKFHKIFLNKAFLLFILLSLLFTQNNRALSQGATSVEVDKVILESLNQTIPVIGRVISLKEANVPAAVIGKIENVFVEVGDKVKKGQILASIDTERYSWLAEIATANVNATKAEIKSAKAVKYNPILDYGGWGIRYRFKTKAYNIKGNKGVRIYLKNGKNILFGSQKHKEFAKIINQNLLQSNE